MTLGYVSLEHLLLSRHPTLLPSSASEGENRQRAQIGSHNSRCLSLLYLSPALPLSFFLWLSLSLVLSVSLALSLRSLALSLQIFGV